MDDGWLSTEELLDRQQRTFRRLEEAIDRGLRLDRDLLDRERAIADRDAVGAKDLVDRRRQGVGAAPDQ